MMKTFQAPEVTKDGVKVSNLPDGADSVDAFTQYNRSTSEFTSLVTPYRSPDDALGAGFGVKPDKRLGFLAPRKPLQPHGSSEIVPKYDENGMPIDETMTREQLFKKRMEYMKSFEGMSVSHNEHFLLADLDFQKDSLLFGNTREEFEQNVSRLKNVIINYSKWERTDNFYYYTTILLQLLTFWVLMECVHQYYELHLFSRHYDEFVETIESEIKQLEVKRQSDLRAALREVTRHKPDFGPVIASMQQEKSKALAEDALSSPMDTTGEVARNSAQRTSEQLRHMENLAMSSSSASTGVLRRLFRYLGLASGSGLSEADFKKYSYSASPTTIQSVREIRRILLPRSEDYTQIVREEMESYQLQKMSKTELA
ncbi:hypothetical protein AGDE_05337 [Angomonas deanei]|nr:hypothetical protein AGDE_05337 [Angomonas deanei]|eukprot:EPY38592.1 hypothetical protein AGDE_05337 [Angomonas deanei]